MTSRAAALAAHRFGLGEPDLSALGADPRGWAMAQLFQPQPLDTTGLISASVARTLTREFLSRAQDSVDSRRQLREASRLALERRWTHQVATRTPVYERWVMFWSNHFTVAATKGTTLGLVAPFENEVIRPHATGRFVDLLRAATLHPGMLVYLDNAQSTGPASRQGQRRGRGLNENLARELLELHTVGVDAGYTQADVTELARLLTGWTIGRGDDGGSRFVAALHDPGTKHVMGRRYPEGPEALDAVLHDLARHPATARHLARRMVRHFVADDPPPVLVEVVTQRFFETGGDLLPAAQALFDHELTWATHAPGKARRPEELLLATHRVLQLPLGRVEPLVGALTAMGQPIGRPPSPQGWPDTEDDWLGADALLKRVEWAAAVGQREGNRIDARAVAERAWGSALSDETRTQVARAESGAQALALLLASPEFQRR